MSNFDWQQEDNRWDEPAAPPTRDSEKRKRPFFIFLVIVLTLFLASFVVYQQVNKQVESTTTAVQTDVLAAHNLVQTAEFSADGELLQSLLSGRLDEWITAQESALAAGVLYGRAPWAFKPVSTAFSEPLRLEDLDGLAHLTLSPELIEAELQFPLAYTIMTGAGISETVVLTQTAVYRRGEQRWLLSPPTAEFWGEWVTKKDQYLTLIYPQRDAELAERFASDLEDLLDQICTHPDLPDCPEAMNIAVRFDTNPDSLIKGTDRRNLFDEQPYLTLPTPTLFGLPQDEAGYEALLGAYRRLLATAVFADLYDWECCRHASVFQVLVDYQLSQMGFLPWPVLDEWHTRGLHESRTLQSLEAYWRSFQFANVDEDGEFLYTVFDFIFREYPALLPSLLLTGLDDNSNLAFWLSEALNQAGYQSGPQITLLESLDNEWWHFAFTETLLAQQKKALPLDLPDQDIALLCTSGTNFDATTTMSLSRFDTEGDISQEMLTYNGFVLFNPFLDDSGVVVQSLDLAETNEWQTEIWQFEGERTLLVNEDNMFFSLGQFDPTGQYIVTFAGEDELATPQPMLIDLTTCADSTCTMLPLPGLPYWSPDGTQTIIGHTNLFDGTAFLRNGRIMLFDAFEPPNIVNFWAGDALGQLPHEEPDVLGTGYSPFWLNNDTFGFVRYHSETGEPEVVIRQMVADTAESEQLETVLTMADIQALIPDSIRAPATIRYVITHPAQPDKLFTVALDALGREAYVFALDRISGTLDLRLQSQIQPFHSLGFSPNGRWLVLIGNDDESIGETSTLYFHDIEANETQTYISDYGSFMFSSLYDWSLDGNWVMFLVNDRVVSMVAPAYDYQLVFAHDQGNCTSMAWINK